MVRKGLHLCEQSVLLLFVKDRYLLLLLWKCITTLTYQTWPSIQDFCPAEKPSLCSSVFVGIELNQWQIVSTTALHVCPNTYFHESFARLQRSAAKRVRPPAPTLLMSFVAQSGVTNGRWRGNFNVQYPQFWISLSATPTGATDAAFSKPLCSGVGFVIGFMLPICYEHFLEGHQCTTPLTKSLRGGSASWRGWLRKATTTTPHILLPYPFVISGYFSLEKKGANFLLSPSVCYLAYVSMLARLSY